VARECWGIFEDIIDGGWGANSWGLAEDSVRRLGEDFVPADDVDGDASPICTSDVALISLLWISTYSTAMTPGDTVLAFFGDLFTNLEWVSRDAIRLSDIGCRNDGGEVFPGEMMKE